jgi:hypothetical protein
MSVATEKELRILWISLEDDSLRMTWAAEASFAGRNNANVKERRHGR